MAGSSEVMNIFQYLHHVDKDVTLVINSWNFPVTDFMWQIFSDKQIWYVFYIVIAFFIFRNLGWKKGLAVTLSIIMTIVCCDQLANLTKDYFQRLRPCMDGDMVAGGLHILEGYSAKYCYGFYSAHAANSMGFAVCSADGFAKNDSSRNYRIYARIAVIWAILVGMSRVFVGKHFMGDVAVGFIVGTVFAKAWAALARYIIKKLSL